MSESPKQTPLERDPKVEALVKFANRDWLNPRLKHPSLAPVADAFRYNIARLRFMMLMPASVGSVAVRAQRLLDFAEFEIKGALGSPEMPEHSDEVEARWLQLLTDENERLKQAQKVDPDWDSKVRESLALGIGPARLVATATAHGYNALLAASITGAWTAFETMSGDLWEAAVNAHPEGLASLGGSANRLTKKDKSEAEPPEQKRSKNDEQPKVRLDLIQMHGFDIREKMGTILRGRFGFSRLEGIREAYCSAFHKRAHKIDGAVGNQALDALSAVRNVIVHRAARADSEYLSKAHRLKLPLINLGGELILDGEIVVGLIGPAMKCAQDLLLYVDEWLAHTENLALNRKVPG
jgi:hypothetical protein